MKILVTDACIFIDVIESEAHYALLDLPFEFKTSSYIWSELDPEQQSILEPWVSSGDLLIEVINKDFVTSSANQGLSSALSVADLSVWHLCRTHGDVLLTSDGTLRKMAKQHNLPTHGLLWAFDEMVHHETLTPDEASIKLEYLFNHNHYYRTDTKLFEAFKQLQQKWKNK